MTAAHWHLSRVAAHPAMDEPGTLDVKGRFFLDVFPDTGSAGAALAADVLNRYPKLKRTRQLAELQTAVASDPGNGLLYESPAGAVVQWRLTECAGDCERTRRQFDEHVREYFARFVAEYSGKRGG